MSPDIVMMTEMEADYNTPFFLSRIREIFTTYLALFESLDEGFQLNCPKRAVFEREVLGRDVINIVACEGTARIPRAEKFAKWKTRLRKSFFHQVPFTSEAINEMQQLLDRCSQSFGILAEDNVLKLLWKSKPVLVASVWKPLTI